MYDKDEGTHMNQKQIGKFISATGRQKELTQAQRVLCLQFKLDILQILVEWCRVSDKNGAEVLG